MSYNKDLAKMPDENSQEYLGKPKKTSENEPAANNKIEQPNKQQIERKNRDRQRFLANFLQP